MECFRKLAMVAVVAIVFGGAAGYLGGSFWGGEEKVVPAKELTGCEVVEKNMADAQTEAAFHYFRNLKIDCVATEEAAISEGRDTALEKYLQGLEKMTLTPVPTPVTLDTHDNLTVAYYEAVTGGIRLLEASGKRLKEGSFISSGGAKFEILGVIKNDSDTEKSVKAEFDVHDKDGYVLGTALGWIMDIAPGRTHHFDAYADSMHDGEVVEISLKKLTLIRW